MSLKSAFRDFLQLEYRITIRHADDSPGFWPAVVKALGAGEEGSGLATALASSGEGGNVLTLTTKPATVDPGFFPYLDLEAIDLASLGKTSIVYLGDGTSPNGDAEFFLFGVTGITSMSFPELTNCQRFGIEDCPDLVTISLPLWVPTDGKNYFFDGNALDEATVNIILVKCAASMTSGGIVDVSGGTNAAPTGAGATAATTLTGNGVTVNTN